jgi:hypothetical protein
MLDVVILNRNLGKVCDLLVGKILELGIENSSIVVVDSGSDMDKVSRYTTIRIDDEDVLNKGLRTSRGFNLGISEVQQRNSPAEWILCLPVDCEIVFADLDSMFAKIVDLPRVVAIKPLQSHDQYLQLMDQENFRIAWYVEEGPLFLRKDYVRSLGRNYGQDYFFDAENFRGYCSTLEISMQAYANGFAFAVTDLVQINENQSYLLESSDLVKTEPADAHLRLMVNEGERWLKSKYGLTDSWAFANIVRLLYTEFLKTYPEYQGYAIDWISDET